MTFHQGFSQSFYTGTGAVSSTVPAVAPVAIQGHEYVIDLAEYDRQTIETIRQQADQSPETGEQSFNPSGQWLRSQDSWHRGAGQEILDEEDSDRRRYWTSKGINPWVRGQLSLHQDTDQKLSSVNSNLTGVAVSSYSYVLDGQALKYTADISAGSPTWVTVTGTPAETPSWIDTDGYRVWVAYPSGLYQTTRAAAAATALGTQDAGMVAYAKGRLLMTHNNELFEMSGAGVATSLYAHPNTDFRWTSIVGGDTVIYAAGYSGDKTEIFKVGIVATTAALTAPSPATSWPDGETLWCMRFYAGILVLGTSRGIRLGRPNNSGNFDYFGPVETHIDVRCLEPESDFCWFGWTNYDGASTGLGRIDFRRFLVDEDVVPAYASDLMATGQGIISSVWTVNSKRYFTVSGLGVFGEDTVKVVSGVFDPGKIRFRTTERKISRSVDVRVEALTGEVLVEVAHDESAYITAGLLDTPGSTGSSSPMSTSQLTGEQLRLRFTLYRDEDDSTLGPTVTRYTLRALVRPPREDRILIPLILKTVVTTDVGIDLYYNPLAEFRYLKSLEADATVVTYQEGNYSVIGFIEQVRWRPTSWQTGQVWMNGTCHVTLQTLGSA